MIGDIFIRFAIGGLVVSPFSIIGDLFKPKSFAGLFGAAPSVALATLLLTIFNKGPAFAAMEAHAMIGGVLALFIYTNCVAYVLMRSSITALVASGISILLWLGVAFSWLLA
jgi:Protein of unknown function (DUF3147)